MTGAAAMAAFAGHARAAAEPEIPPHPDPASFQSGDLLWPALPDTIIPYSRSVGVSREDAAWIKERDAFLQTMPASADPASQALRERISNMSYSEFRALYLQDSESQPEKPGNMTTRTFKIPSVAVGHVAILDVGKDKVPRVIEAVPKGKKRFEIVTDRFQDGVIVTPYREWIDVHKDYKVWHGRVKTEKKRSQIAAAAKSFLKRDYWFWSFDFSDETAFYCSKLVWVSAYKGLGIALDGDANTSRQLWLSPKRLMKLDTVTMLHNPGKYG
jgi:hypothetical protein